MNRKKQSGELIWGSVLEFESQFARCKHFRRDLVQPGAFYIMDQAYIDFERLYQRHLVRETQILRTLQEIDSDSDLYDNGNQY